MKKTYEPPKAVRRTNLTMSATAGCGLSGNPPCDG